MLKGAFNTKFSAKVSNPPYFAGIPAAPIIETEYNKIIIPLYLQIKK